MKPFAVILCLSGSLGAAASGVVYQPLAYAACSAIAIVGLLVMFSETRDANGLL